MKNILIILIINTICSPAFATLIQWDAFSTSDELAVKDTNTGLVWLDLSVTAGQSFNDASNIYDGWVLPTFSQIDTLLHNAFPNLTLSSGLNYQQACITLNCEKDYLTWSSLFGAVSFNRYSLGIYTNEADQLTLGGASFTFIVGGGKIFNFFGTDYQTSINRDSGYNLWSTFLVQESSIPIPPSALLMSQEVSEPPTLWLVIFSSLIMLTRSLHKN